MTSAQVNGASNGLIEFINAVQKTQTKMDSSNDFSKMMETKSDPIDQIETNKFEKVKETNQVDSTEETKTQTNDYEKFENKTVDVEDKMKSIEEIVEDTKKEIAKILDITVEELEQAMQNLGLSNLHLLDVSNYPTLLAEVVGEEPISILTDSELSETLNELIHMVVETDLNLETELNISPKELMNLVNEMEDSSPENFEMPDMHIAEEMESVEGQNVVLQEQSTNTDIVGRLEVEQRDVEQENAKVMIDGGQEEVVVTVENNQNQTNMSENHSEGNLMNQTEAEVGQSEEANLNGGVVQEFAEQILTNIENAVTEITSTTETVDAEGIMRQIVNHVKVGVSSEVTTMELQLQPENLGKLDLQVALKDGELVAEFKTENEAVKNLIEGQLIHLKETLEQQGLKVSSVEVSVEQQSLQHNMGQNQNGQGTYQEERKQNIRKINLQGIRSLEEIEFEDLDEDELMTAKLMLQNGNTVDFTA